MQRHYLRLAAFACNACKGPVISGSFTTRENEIQRETDIREIGSVCLSCGKTYSSIPVTSRVLYIAPLDWEEPYSADRQQVASKKKAPNAKSPSLVKEYIQ